MAARARESGFLLECSSEGAEYPNFKFRVCTCAIADNKRSSPHCSLVDACFYNKHASCLLVTVKVEGLFRNQTIHHG